MDKKAVFQNDYYVISEDFRLISFNESVARTYKDAKVGAHCYKVTMNRDTPCLHCPIAGNTDCDCPVYYDPFYQTWIEAIFSEIGNGRYAVSCRPAQNRGLRVFDEMGKEAKDELIRELSGRAVNDRIVEIEQELAEAMKKIEKSNNAKSIFLNAMSHDIRTPMNAIMGFARLMEKNVNNPALVSKYLEKIEHSGEYLVTILNDLLEFVHFDDGVMDIDENICDISEARQNFINLFEYEVQKNKIRLNCSINIQHKYIITDAVKIQQIMVNLMSNALKYTPAGGQIDVNLTEYECDKEGYGKYVTTVTDYGIGMSNEKIENLFNAYTNEDNKRENINYRNGLGLAVAKKYIDCLGGDLKVKSEIGVGTTFTLTMNYKISSQKSSYSRGLHAYVGKSLAGKRILIAEDNDLNAEILAAILKEQGIESDRVDDGVACIDKLNKESADYYDLILMDIQMPNLDGNKTCELIRKMPNTKKSKIPVIALSANAFAEDKRKASEAGMNDYVTKPIIIPELLTILEKYL